MSKVDTLTKELPLLIDETGQPVLFDKDRRFDDFQDHPWVQIAYELHCNPCPKGRFSAHMARLKPGFMLVGSLGNWSIVRESEHNSMRIKPR